MMMECPHSGLILPKQFIDEKEALKKLVDQLVESAVMANQHRDGTYYLMFHAKFDKFTPDQFNVTPPIVVENLPPFVTNSLVYWVNNRQGICELLWVVPARGKDGKLRVDFNTSGVAYLKAKGAMPS